MARICIGIPCYRDVAGETLEDYMRLAFYAGRKTEHEYMIAIKTKTEQFRARNMIVEGALQTGCDYLFFLDDDHVIDWTTNPSSNAPCYAIIEQLKAHLDADPELGIVGALYYHRGAECRPVLLNDSDVGAPAWLRDDEIRNELQEVAVQGGGCMLLRMSMFDKLEHPYFAPEHDMGTDLQICQQARAAGYKVACDTSIKIGHVMSRREVVTPENRHRIAVDNARLSNASGGDGIDPDWTVSSSLLLYRMDAQEYLKTDLNGIAAMALEYDPADIAKRDGTIREYYASRGNAQLARQVAFHHLQTQQAEMELYHKVINTEAPGYGADIGCGSAPVGFEFAMRGHKMDFIDVDGAGAYEFLKWRVARRGLSALCGFKLAGPYDYVVLLDAIEHFEDWRGDLMDVCSRIKDGGFLLTNYFKTFDADNPEHISLDHDAVKDYLTGELGVFALNDMLWTKRDINQSTAA